MKRDLSSCVVITTYNGEKYIIQQLDSIRTQTCTPQEVLIFDDKSNDRTPYMVSKYINKYGLRNWKLYKNEHNLGWKKNFMQGFGKSTSDLIFPCDQDDIWDSHKIEIMSKVMQRKEINVLCCNIVPFSDDGSSAYIAKFNLAKYGNNEVECVLFDKMWMNPMRQGCTMCFRSEILPYIDRIWFDKCAHDLALWAYAMSTDSLFIINREFVKFRRHVGNNTPSNKKDKNTRINNIKIQIQLANNIEHELLYKYDKNYDEMEIMKKFFIERTLLMQKPTPKLIWKAITKIKLYPKKASFLGDLIAACR